MARQSIDRDPITRCAFYARILVISAHRVFPSKIQDRSRKSSARPRNFHFHRNNEDARAGSYTWRARSCEFKYKNTRVLQRHGRSPFLFSRGPFPPPLPPRPFPFSLFAHPGTKGEIRRRPEFALRHEAVKSARSSTKERRIYLETDL